MTAATETETHMPVMDKADALDCILSRLPPMPLRFQVSSIRSVTP